MKLNELEEKSFIERYRLVLKQILDGSVKEVTFIWRFCSETKVLFQKVDKSCHERLWTDSGLRDSSISDSIHYISILRYLIPVIGTKILEEEIKPKILAFQFTNMDQEFSDTISVLLEFVNVPPSYIDHHFRACSPVKIKFDALNMLKTPFLLKGDKHSVLVLRYILNKKLSPEAPRLRAIGDMIPESSDSTDCKVLKILFEGQDTELPEDMSIHCFFDALKYFSRYLSDPRMELKQSLLKNFSKILKVTDPRISLRVVDGLVRYGASINYQFVHKTLEDILKSYIDDDDGIPSQRDPEEYYIDRKILSCTLEACGHFFKPNVKDDIKILFEGLLLSPKLEINHRVVCLQILTKLASKENSNQRMNSDLWFRHTTCRYWEIQETFLLYISKLVLLNQTKGIPPLKGFISLQLKHENSFVRAASINVLRSVVLCEGSLGLSKIIDSTDIEKFFRLIFESETEAIVRREAANLLSILEMSDMIKKTSIFVLENDLDWEVKEIIIDMWESHLNDPLALVALEIAKIDHEKRLRQKAFKLLKKMGKQCDEENCFDEYVDVIYGLPGLMNDILQTKDELYKTYDADCF